MTEYHKCREQVGALTRQWNKAVDQYNFTSGRVTIITSPTGECKRVRLPSRSFGRPLQVGDKQREGVLKLHKEGMSLRDLAEEKSLGHTVRTIVDKKDRKDRGAVQLLERIAGPDKLQAARERMEKKLRDTLPKSVRMTREALDEAIKEAKGLMKR